MTTPDHAPLPLALAAIIEERLGRADLATPELPFAAQVLADNFAHFRDSLALAPGAIYFPVKANDHPGVLALLRDLGAGFEIASAGELAVLQQLGVPGARIAFGNPVKIAAQVSAAYAYGVRLFAFDTSGELRKLAAHAPGAGVYLRLAVDNAGADWQLSGKFGAPPAQALWLLEEARRLHLDLVGISFHVGWNNANLSAWQAAVQAAETLARHALAAHLPLRTVNLGGGFPAHRVEPYRLLAAIIEQLAPALARLRQELGLEIAAEPGSFLVANAGAVVTRVIEVIERAGVRWAFVDASMANGFYWALGGVQYDVIYPYGGEGLAQPYHVTGATCDSHDLFARDAWLPARLGPGDCLLIYPAGAYITSARTYNGVPYPELHIV